MKIHVFITYDVEEPAAVPGSVARTVEFGDDIEAHRLVQLAQDTAQEVAVGYLQHVRPGAPSRVRCTCGAGSDEDCSGPGDYIPPCPASQPK